MRIIPLSKGKVALVDHADWHRLQTKKWCLGGSGYAVADGGSTSMHRTIVDAPLDLQVDHVNHDPLDNRRINLRLCTRTQNHANTAKRRDSTSPFKGVTWNKRKSKWFARVRAHNIQYFLGYFTDPVEAAKAYDRAAIEHFGEFAMLNFRRPR